MKVTPVLIAIILSIAVSGVVGAAGEKENIYRILQPLEKRIVRIAPGNIEPAKLTESAYLFHGVILNDQLVLTTSHGTDDLFSFWIERRTAKSSFKSAICDYMVLYVYHGYGLAPLKFADSPDQKDRLFMPVKRGTRWIWMGPGKIIKIGNEILLTTGLPARVGDSGKPVFNDRGELVGLVRSISEEFTYLLRADIIAAQLHMIDSQIEPFFFK